MTDRERINALREGICKLEKYLDHLCAIVPHDEMQEFRMYYRYNTIFTTIEILGGSCVLDDSGHHKISIMGFDG